MGGRVRSCVFGPFSVRPRCHRVRSVHSRASWGSPASFGYVRYIALGVVGCSGYIQLRPGERRVRLGALGPFPCALLVVGFVGVHSVHSRVPCGSYCSFVCHSRAPLRSSVRWCAFGPFTCALGVVGSFAFVRSIPVRPWGLRVRSHSPWGSFGFFQA